MNQRNQTAAGLAVVALALTAPVFAGPSGSSAQFIELEGTRSPDGHYAIAWTHLDPSPFEAETEQEFLAAIDARQVRNYLVDMRRNIVVASLHTNYFEYENRRKVDASFEAKWHPEGKAVLVAEQGKDETRAIDLVRLPDFEVLPMEDLARREFTDYISVERIYFPLKGAVMRFGNFTWTGPDRVQLKAEAERLNSWMPTIKRDFTAIWQEGERVRFVPLKDFHL